MSADDSLFDQAAPIVVERLGRALLGIQDELRGSYLEDRLKDAPVLPLVRALACAQREAVMGQLGARVLVETFSTIVHAGKIDPSVRAAIVTGAQMIKEDAVVPLVERAAANDPDSDPRGGRAKRGTLAEQGETLGRRKWLARTASGDMLLRILDDPHPDVVRNALLNPKVTEELAVRVAARRPVPPQVLEVVSRSRFSNRHSVRRALVMNPDCPTKLAVRLVATMTASDLEEVVTSQGIAPEVKSAAEMLLDGRSTRQH